MIYDVNHVTTFEYAQPVSVSHQLLRLTPRPHERQRIDRSTILIEPAPAVRARRRDYFANEVTYVTVQEPHDRLTIHASSRIEVDSVNDAFLDLGPCWEEVAERLRAPRALEAIDASQFCFASPYVDFDAGVQEFVRGTFVPGAALLPAVMDLTARIHKEFDYEGGVTDVWTPVSEVLEHRKGVCQDFAHLEIACLRSLGLAARYVSGYLLTRPPAGRERLVGADASHAWLSVYCPGLGWVDVDPTNNLRPSDEHIALAWGRDYGDVSPTTGVIVGGGAHSVSVSVDVAAVGAPG
jgi:transglutaminase-like putative cysteine protease